MTNGKIKAVHYSGRFRVLSLSSNDVILVFGSSIPHSVGMGQKWHISHKQGTPHAEEKVICINFCAICISHEYAIKFAQFVAFLNGLRGKSIRTVSYLEAIKTRK